MKKILLVLLMLALPCTSFSAEATMPGANFWKGAAKGAATVYGVSKLPNKALGLAAAGTWGWALKKDYDKKKLMRLSEGELKDLIGFLAESARARAEDERKRKGRECSPEDLFNFQKTPAVFNALPSVRAAKTKSRNVLDTVFGDVDSYSSLAQKRQKRNEYEKKNPNPKAGNRPYLEMDHIPSGAAIIEYMKNKGFGANEGKVYQNLTAIALTLDVHKSGATYKGKNNALKKEDGLNQYTLRAAAVRDVSAEAFYIQQSEDTGLLVEYIDSVKDLFLRNEQLCLYQ